MPTAPAPILDTGPAWAHRFEQWFRYDSRARRWAVVVLAAAVTVLVAGTAAEPPLRPACWVLLGANVAVLTVRLLPGRAGTWLAAVPFYVTGALLAGAVLAVDVTNVTSLFAFMLAGQAGYRLPAERAVRVAGLIAAVAVAGLVVGSTAGWIQTPVWTGLLTGLPVLLGVGRRTREATEVALRDAAQARAREAEAEARARSSAERARVARDVHDVLAHSLAGVNLQLEVVDALLEQGDAVAARQAAARAQQQVRAGMTEVSRTVRALRADAPPLVETVTAIVDAAAPADCTLRVDGEPRELPGPTATALTRAVQESLTNAAKHAPGSAVQVTLRFAPGLVAVEVVNGRPRRPAVLADTGSGLGLVGLRERIGLLGGTVRTGPGPDHDGWSVHVEVPT